MARLELCTAGDMGPYLLAPDEQADELRERFGAAGIPCAVECGVAQDGGTSRCIVAFGVGANLAVISRFLNDAGYDWALAGWEEAS